MTSFDLRRLDMNLVVALHALLEEGSVSAGARRLGVTQSAASRSLSRLRRHFNDDLLVRDRGATVLTPFAASLRPAVRDAVKGLSSLFASASRFDPATSEREFTVATSDYGTAMLAPPLLREFARTAPSCSVRMVPLPSPDAFPEHLVSADAIVLPRGMDPPGPAIDLFQDEWCCVVDRNQADEVRTWNAADFSRAAGWVANEIHGGVPGLEGVRTSGIDVRLTATTSTFTAVSLAVSGTPLIGIVQRRLAELMAPACGTSVLPWPVALPSIHIVAFHDAARLDDPASRWFLDLLARSGGALAGGALASGELT